MFEKNVIFAGGFRLDVDKLIRVRNIFFRCGRGIVIEKETNN